jgi:hypothetical protein
MGAKTCLKHTGAERAGNIIVSSGVKREDNLNIGAVERELFTSGYGTSGYGTSATNDLSQGESGSGLYTDALRRAGHFAF